MLSTCMLFLKRVDNVHGKGIKLFIFMVTGFDVISHCTFIVSKLLLSVLNLTKINDLQRIRSRNMNDITGLIHFQFKTATVDIEPKNMSIYN